jgi:hypothetical protein
MGCAIGASIVAVLIASCAAPPQRTGLEPLPGVRAGAGDLTNAFDFGG